MSDFEYTPDSPPPPGGRAWLDEPPVQHGALWRFGEWLLTEGNLETVLCCAILAMFSIFVIAGWLVGGR